MRHPAGNVAQAAPSGRVLVLAGGKSSWRGRPESAEWRGRSCHCGEGGLSWVGVERGLLRKSCSPGRGLR